MPEGLPGDEELGNVTTGLLQGFFGRGMYLEVFDKQDPYDSISVDMNMCVNRNLGFFQQVWSEAIFMIARAVASGAPDMDALDDNKAKLQFGTQLAFTMMQVPGAMKKCGISSDQEDMVMDSLKALGSHTKYRFKL